MAEEHGDLDRFIATAEDITVHHKAKPDKKAAGGNVHIYHGTPGDPGYPALHPGNHKGKTKTSGGGVLGSDRYTEAEHKEAAEEYLFEAYAMNKWLRDHKLAEGTANDPEDLEDYNSKLMDLIQVQEPSTEDQVFYRGLGTKFGTVGKGRNAGTLKPGDEFDDNGFISSSERLEVAEKFAALGPDGSDHFMDGFIMEITVPKGTRYLDTDKTIHANPQWERERILMPGTRFRVKGYVKGRFDAQKKAILQVEAIPPE